MCRAKIWAFDENTLDLPPRGWYNQSITLKEVGGVLFEYALHYENLLIFLGMWAELGRILLAGLLTQNMEERCEL